MTVFEKIKGKNIDELVNWIDEHFAFDDAPYWHFWDENHCNKCEPVVRTDEDGHKKEYAYCEVYGNCRFFKDMDDIPDHKQIIKIWLESECN